MDSRFLSATVGTVAGGTLLAFTIGVVTRPALFGTLLPIRLLFSHQPDDTTAKIELISHLGTMTSGGLALSAAAALILVKTLKL